MNSADAVLVRWQQSDGYFDEFWTDWMRHRAKYRKWVVPFSLICLVFGASIVLGAVPNKYSPVRTGWLLLVVGVFELAWHFWDKSRWFKLVTKSETEGDFIEMRFEPSGLFVTTLNSKAEIKWGGLTDFVRASHGTFIVFGKELSTYVPDCVFESSNDLEKVENWYRCATD